MNYSEFFDKLRNTDGQVSIRQGVVHFPDGQQYALPAEPLNQVEITDWRHVENPAMDTPALLTTPGVLRLVRGGYGAALEVQMPDGRQASLGLEFDAGALRTTVFPPDAAEPDEGCSDMFAVSLVVENGAVIVSDNLGGRATLYSTNSEVSDCQPYDGDTVLQGMTRARPRP